MEYEACEVVEVDFPKKRIIGRGFNFDQIERQRAYDTYMRYYHAIKLKADDTMRHHFMTLEAIQHPYVNVYLYHQLAIQYEAIAKLEHKIAEDFKRKAELEALHAVC